jgi:hypothetical protein
MLRFVASMSFLLLTVSTSIFGQSTVTSGSQTTITYTTAGSYTFTVPARVSSVTIKAWGGGGGGQAKQVFNVKQMFNLAICRVVCAIPTQQAEKSPFYLFSCHHKQDSSANLSLLFPTFAPKI